MQEEMHLEAVLSLGIPAVHPEGHSLNEIPENKVHQATNRIRQLKFELVVASSIGSDLAMEFLTNAKIKVNLEEMCKI